MPAFAPDDDYRFEVDWIDEDDLCPNCKESLLKHTQLQRIECVLMLIKYPKNWESKRGERH